MANIPIESDLDDGVKFKSGKNMEGNVFAPGFIRSRMPEHGEVRGYGSQNGVQRHPSQGSESSEDDTFSDLPGQDKSATKPLMYPRQRVRVAHQQPPRTFQQIFWPFIYVLLCIAAVVSFVGLVVYFVNSYASRLLAGSSSRHNMSLLIGCSHIKVKDVWVVGLPKLLTESSVRLVDVNQDTVLDPIFGFATGAEGYNVPDIVCDIYFDGKHPCLGGVLALDGRSGETLWRYNAEHEIFSVNCNIDLTGDGVEDCLVAGRVGMFTALSGADGQVLWSFHGTEKNKVMNLYTAQFLPDLNGDGVPDVLNIHGGDPFGEPGSATRVPGKVLIFSGADGQILSSSVVPDGRESYYSPVLHQSQDGTTTVLFGTGGETHGGALWYITLHDLYKGNIDKIIFQDGHKGVMTPPVLIDLNKDAVRDIVFTAYNSSLLAYDGANYTLMWNFTYPFSETYASPAPGYYNDDDVPDFMVSWQYGPGFPIYYHTAVTVVDGRTGKAMVSPYVRSTVGAQTSPLTISAEGYGNDLFLYWKADCHNHEGEGGQYTFVKGTNVHEQSRADSCRLRFKSRGFSRLYALSGNIPAPGAVLYDSGTHPECDGAQVILVCVIQDKSVAYAALQSQKAVSAHFTNDRTEVEHSVWVNTSLEALEWLRNNPDSYEDARRWFQYAKENEEEDEKGRHPEKEDSREENSWNIQNVEDDDGYPSDTEREYPFNADVNDYRWEDDSEQPYVPDIAQRPWTRPQSQSYANRDEVSKLLRQGAREWGVPPEKNRQDWRGHSSSSEAQRYPSLEDLGKYGADEDIYKKMVDALSGYEQQPAYPPLSRSRTRSRDPYSDYRRPSSSSSRRGRKSVPSHRGDVRNSRSAGDARRRALVEDAWKPFKHVNSPTAVKSAGKFSGHARNKRSANNARRESQSHISPRDKVSKSERKKRHVGPHDAGGMQRLISTGTLAPSLLEKSHPDYHYSVDHIFLSYWFFPAKTRILLPEDEKCVQLKMEQQLQRFDPKSKYYGMDDDGYGHAIAHECLEESGHLPTKNTTYESQHSYNPFNVHMGQMTAYRLQLTCSCEGDPRMRLAGATCSRVLPFEKQQWGAYMGLDANSMWRPRA